MKRNSIHAAVAGMLLLAPAIYWARTPVNVAKLGPQVGQRVPDFSLKDPQGKVWTRDSIMGPNGAMLVFFRSADW